MPYTLCPPKQPKHRDTEIPAVPPYPLPFRREGAILRKLMSTLMEIEEAAAQLPSPDFVQLLEDLHDFATARVALGELEENPAAAVAWDQLKRELDALHG
jgi:hypothetical protein